jgi:hypothetical protein
MVDEAQRTVLQESLAQVQLLLLTDWHDFQRAVARGTGASEGTTERMLWSVYLACHMAP